MRRQGCNANGEVYTSPYDEHEPVTVDASHDGLTRQEFADECDINVLMARYEKTGVITHYSRKEPAYFDASEVPDLATALHMAEEAERAFMQLPASARREFDNDAVKFVEYAQDPANLPRMREWGLAPPEAVPDAPMRVEVVNPASPAPGDPTPS